MPYTPALETSDHPMSREWSSENLPEILFYLTTPKSRFSDAKVQYLRDEETGKVVLSEEGNKIKDFEILPRYISVEVEGSSQSLFHPEPQANLEKAGWLRLGAELTVESHTRTFWIARDLTLHSAVSV